MNKILITGGTGYIGSHTVVELQQAGYDVLIFDSLENSTEEVLLQIEKITGLKPTFVKGDIRQQSELNELFLQEFKVKNKARKKIFFSRFILCFL